MSSVSRQGLGRDVADLGMGGAAAMFATLFTNPIEVVKTRLQLQGELAARGRSRARLYRGVLHALLAVARHEGLAALQSGLPAMLGFQFFLNTFRLGVYRISERRGLTTDENGHTSLLKGAAAAGVGGALGSIAGTPFFLVKTRLQSQAARAIAVGHQHQHAGTFGALSDIYRKEGVIGLFRGVQPQIPRGAVGSGSQMVSFSFAKEQLLERGFFRDSPLLLSFFGANLAVDAQSRGQLYGGMADCFVKMVRTEGAAALYKGVGANYLRLGPHTVLLLVAWDQLKMIEERLRR